MTTASYAIADSATMLRRDFRHMLRYPSMTLQLIGLPIVLLLLFRFMFGGAINVAGMAYIDYLVPGLVVVSIGFNSL